MNTDLQIDCATSLEILFQISEELLKAVSSAHHGSSAAVTVLKEDVIS